MADAMWMKIRDVDWTAYETSSGDGSSMPTILKNLSSRKLPRATKASHKLWTALCNGGSVYSAVVPAIPLLLEIFTISEPEIQDAIIDVIARCDQAELTTEWAEELKFLVVQAKEDLEHKYIKDEIVKLKIAALVASD